MRRFCLVLAFCSVAFSGAPVEADDSANDAAAFVRYFFEASSEELEGGLPRGEDLDWISRFLSERLYERFRDALEYQEEWIRRNPDRPPMYLKPPFADGVHFTGSPDAISSFIVLRPQPQMPAMWHVPIQFFFEEEGFHSEGVVIVKTERSRFVIDEVIFLAADPENETWCLSESLEWRDSD
jgi:hypothetical protein